MHVVEKLKESQNKKDFVHKYENGNERSEENWNLWRKKVIETAMQEYAFKNLSI